MKILQLTPAPQGTFLVWENGRKVTVMCFALCHHQEEDMQSILPCILTHHGIAPYQPLDAKVVL